MPSKDGIEPDATEPKADSFELNAEILLLDEGVAFSKEARILEMTSSGAWVEVEHVLQRGQKLGLVIRGLASDLFKVFGLSGHGADKKATVKTQGEVTVIRKATMGGIEYCRGYIQFTGNIRVASKG